MDEHFQQLVLADTTDIAGIDDLEENNCGAQGIPRGWPEWSLPPPLPPPYPPPLPPPLPPPDESFVKENVVDDAAKGDDVQDSSMQAAAEKGASFENNNSSTVQSLSQGKSSTLGLVPAVESGRSQNENSALAVIEGREEKLAASSVQAEYKQQSTDKTMTPSRPTTPESPRSTHDPVVTGQNRSRQNNAAAAAPGNGEQDLECRNQESDNPYKTATENDFVAENDLTENNNGLYAELQKALESSQLNVSFLVGELRKKDSFCASLRTYIHLLNQELEVSRGQCAQLQERVEELTRYLDQSAVLEAESQELIRMIQEMYLWKEQQCNRLEEMYAGKEQQCNRLVEDLQSAVAMQEFLQCREENLRLDCERRLEERLVEVRRAFDNAETGKVRTLKEKLAREKRKRKEIEEKSKALLKETRRLRALPRQMKSKEEGSVAFGCSYEDDVSSHTASSEVKGDEYPGSSNHNQHSDSDDSSEDELFEDARDEFYFP